jgi:hypothetical protein
MSIVVITILSALYYLAIFSRMPFQLSYKTNGKVAACLYPLGNYTQVVESGFASKSSLTGLKEHSVSAIVYNISAGQESISVGTDGIAYLIEKNGSHYSLYYSANFRNWKLVNPDPLPVGYSIQTGKDLSVTREGSIIITAGKEVNDQNITTFFVSSNDGLQFFPVMNISLRAERFNVNESVEANLNRGVWHNVAETSNGTLFAGLYGPQALVYRSDNHGRNWTLIFNGSKLEDHWENEIHDVEYDYYNNAVYLITDDEWGPLPHNRTMWVSTDYGVTWHELYSSILGGEGLPKDEVYVTIGFLCGGREMILGVDNQNAHWVDIAKVYGNGSIQFVARSAYLTSNIADDGNTYWIAPVNNYTALLANAAVSPSRYGASLIQLNSNGSLSILFLLKGSTNPPPLFAQIAGPNSTGYFAVLASNSTLWGLIIFRPVLQQLETYRGLFDLLPNSIECDYSEWTC